MPDGSTKPEVAIKRPPRPLPADWRRALANAIATELECGWRSSRATRAIHPTGQPSGNSAGHTGGYPPPHPTSELLWDTPWVAGVVEANDVLELPRLAWSLEQPTLARALAERDDPETVFGLFNMRRGDARPGVTRRIFLVKPDRHGKKRYRRNSEIVSERIASIYEAAAEIATAWIIPLEAGVPDEDVL